MTLFFLAGKPNTIYLVPTLSIYLFRVHDTLMIPNFLRY